MTSQKENTNLVRSLRNLIEIKKSSIESIESVYKNIKRSIGKI